MAEETLLIVEDNDILREGLHEMLTFEGFSVATAKNGLDALVQMKTITPALIVSDIAMPAMDGFEFLKSVRSHPEWVTIPFIFLTARLGDMDILAGRNLGAEDYLTKPLSREELVATIRSRLGRSLQLKMAQLQNAYLESLEILANSIDQRISFFEGHSRRVTQFVLPIAKRMGWNEKRLVQLRYSAILHDIGKITIPEVYLLKNQPLSEEEWSQVRLHPVTSVDMIRDVVYLTEIIPIVRHHHERWDGLGYPDGLSAESIPEGSRIISVADSFDAMTSLRNYRLTLEPEAAYEEIQSLAGKNYDPGVVTAFQDAWEAGEIQSIMTKRGSY